MLKVVKASIYDSFMCTASGCPDNCCNNEWNIVIDEETYGKYKALGIPDMDSKVTATLPHVIIKHDKKCPFITEDGLCIFHRDYGEKYLSNTCKSYPRFVSTYGDTYLETLGMSCPAVAQLVISLTEYLDFEEKVYYEDKAELRKDFPALPIEKETREHISLFVGGGVKRHIYEEIYKSVSDKELIPDISIPKTIENLAKWFADNSCSKYYSALFENDYCVSCGERKELDLTEMIIEESYPWFASNFNRLFFFEHYMLESLKQEPQYTSVVLECAIVWELCVAALTFRRLQGDYIDEETIVECTYKLMRLIDHDENILKELSKVV